jgi:solute carrier family 25 carnitine/acylcarnitine transporter 20/29
VLIRPKPETKQSASIRGASVASEAKTIVIVTFTSRQTNLYTHQFKMLSEAWIDFASGWISGGVSVLVIQPIDTVLTRLQASTAKVAQPCVQTSVVSASKSAAAVSLRPSAIARSMISDFGLSSLWRGSSAMIGAVPLQNALLMTGYGVGKRFSFGDDETDGASSSNVLCGVFVGGCTGKFK